MSTLLLDDLELYYETVGAGPPLLLVPGLGSDSLTWLPVRQTLAARFTLILPDIRGAGRSRPHEAPFSIPRVAMDLERLLDHLGIERCHVLGHSLGGLIGHEFAATRPERVGRLVLEASGRLDPGTRLLFSDLATAREAGVPMDVWFRLLFQWLFRPSYFNDPARAVASSRAAAGYTALQSARAFRNQVESVTQADLAPGHAVQAATLLLCGELDRLVPPATSIASFATVPDQRVLVVDDAAHVVHHDRPAAFTAAVIEFLLQAS
jgi:pimeloyl-ACP methyl ester carboxylesterase